MSFKSKVKETISIIVRAFTPAFILDMIGEIKAIWKPRQYASGCFVEGFNLMSTEERILYTLREIEDLIKVKKKPKKKPVKKRKKK